MVRIRKTTSKFTYKLAIISHRLAKYCELIEAVSELCYVACCFFRITDYISVFLSVNEVLTHKAGRSSDVAG